MSLSPQAKRLVEAEARAEVDALKHRYRTRLDQIQDAFAPSLSNGEMALALGLPVGDVGRIKSEKPQSRHFLPDAFTRAAVDRLAHGALWIALLETGARRREVLVCTPDEAQRLAREWVVVSVPDGVIERVTSWDTDDLWDLFGEAPRRTHTGAVAYGPRQVGPPEDALLLSPLGLGGMRLSTTGRPPRSDALKVLHAAFEAGLNWVDTAHVYAEDETDLGHNEALIAEALRTWDQPVAVASKAGLARRGARWLPDGRPESLIAGCEGSLKALGVERIDLFQLHVVDNRVSLADSLGALVRLQEQGKVRHLGVCNVTAEQLAEARTLAPIRTVQNAANPFDRAAFTDGTVAACRDAEGAGGLLFIAHSPSGGHRGLRRALGDPVLRAIAGAHEVTPQTVALAWLLTLGPHVAAIPGATQLATVEALGDALRLQLTPEEMQMLDEAFPFATAARATTTPRPTDDAGEAVVIMGSPASGKSSLVTPFVAQGYVRLNRDEQGGKLDDLVPLLERAHASGARRFVLDNTYGSVKSRAALVSACAALELPARVIWLDTPVAEARYNAALRMVRRYGKLLGPAEIAAERDAPNTFPPVVLSQYAKGFEAPTEAEGFAAIEKLDFVRQADPAYTGKALFLDYDGTLRKTKSGAKYPADPDDVEILPGRIEVLQRYLADGFRLVGVSNQSGVSSGKIELAAAVACFERTNALLGLDIEYLFCPHPAGPPRCFCRKPMPGMAAFFIHKYRLDPAQCLMVGDMTSDKTFAAGAGIPYRDAADLFGD